MKFLLVVLLTLTVQAQVNNGDTIKATQYNGDVHSIGDVKTSLLNESSFAAIHGDCWVLYNNESDVNPADGIPDNIDLTNTDLAIHLGNSIPSAAGRVLRAKGLNSATILGATQEDAFKEHSHLTAPYFASPTGFWSGSGLDGTSSVSGSGKIMGSSSGTYSSRKRYYTSKVGQDADETRMKNITVNMYIKVNKVCN